MKQQSKPQEHWRAKILFVVEESIGTKYAPVLPQISKYLIELLLILFGC